MQDWEKTLVIKIFVNSHHGFSEMASLISQYHSLDPVEDASHGEVLTVARPDGIGGWWEGFKPSSKLLPKKWLHNKEPWG